MCKHTHVGVASQGVMTTQRDTSIRCRSPGRSEGSEEMGTEERAAGWRPRSGTSQAPGWALCLPRAQECLHTSCHWANTRFTSPSLQARPMPYPHGLAGTGAHSEFRVTPGQPLPVTQMSQPGRGTDPPPARPPSLALGKSPQETWPAACTKGLRLVPSPDGGGLRCREMGVRGGECDTHRL